VCATELPDPPPPPPKTPKPTKPSKQPKQAQGTEDNEDGEEQTKKKLRPDVKSLVPLPCVSLGDAKNDFGNQFKWRLQMLAPCKDYSLTGVDNHYSRYEATLEWAKRFHVPIVVEDYCKRLPSDKGAMRYQRDNGSRLLYTLMNTNLRSTLDMNHGIVAEAVLPQFTSDRASCLMLNGPMGGVVGLSSVSLWTVGQGSTALPRLLRDILVKLVQASRGLDKKPMHYSVTTKSTSLVFDQKTVTEGRFEMKTNFGRDERALGFDVKDDVDPHLLERIAEYRKVDVDHVVPPERNHYDSSTGLREEERSQKETVNHLFSVHVLKEIHNGLHANGEVAKIITQELRLTSRIPGTDMHLFLKQACDMMPDLKNDLSELWRESILLLKAEGNLNTENMYSPNTAMSALYLTCPALITLAAQVYADENGITNLEIFPRIDVRNRAEMESYKKRLSEALQRNTQNWDKISTEVNDIDLNSRKCKSSHLPMEEYDPAMYDTRGWHIRSMPRATVLEQKEELLEMRKEAAIKNGESAHGAEVDFETDWQKWDGAQLQDATHYYFETLGWKPLIGGVCLRINTDFIPGRMDKTFLGWNMPVPEDCSPLASLYLNIRKETRDHLDVFWREGGPVADLKWIKMNFCKNLPMSVIRMHIALNKPPATEEESKWKAKNPREVGIKELVGVLGRNEFYEHMNHASEVCSPDEHGIVQYRIFQASKKEWIQKMLRSELEQWRSAAMVIEDLAAFQNPLGREWSSLTRPFFARVEEGGTVLKGEVSMDWFNVATLYNEETWHDLDLDVNLGNRHIVNGMIYSGIALAMNNDSSSTYGFPLKLEDGGHCFDVLCHEFGRPALATVDYKSPGAGADQVCQLLAMIMMVYALYVCEGDVRKVHENDWHKDTLVNTCSRMQLQVVGGCGSFKTGGEGVDISSDTRNKFGSFLYWTEYGKTADDATAKGLYGCIERILAHSGKGGFMDEMRWQTTLNSKQSSVVSWGTGMLLLICSNIKEKYQPKSLFNGARMTCYSSATSDDAGVLRSKQKFSQERTDVSRPAKKSRSSGVLTFRSSQRDTKKNGEMGIVTQDAARQHRLFFFVLYLCRRSFAYFAKGFLTCLPPWLVNSYADNSTICSGLESMTVQVRRRHLETATDFERNCRGPCFSATVLGIWIHSYATRAALQAMNEAEQDSEGAMTVKLDDVFDNLVLAFRMVPVDLSSTLSGVYSWLHNCVLDHNVMLVSCYMMQTMGLRQYCSVVTMGLVMNGFHHLLDQAQLQEYEGLCAFLVEVVTEPEPGAPPARIIRNPYCRLVREEMLKWTQKDAVDGQDFSLEKLMQWFNYNDDSARPDINGFTQANRDPSPSGYLMNTVDMGVKNKPSWVRARENQGRGRPGGNSSDYGCSTAQKAVAQTFADMQTREAEDMRETEQGENYREWQSLAEFWHQAQKGVRLPTKSTDDAKQEARDLNFIDPQLTHHFWLRTMKTVDKLDGLMQEFFALLNVEHGATRHSIVQKLLGPYLEKHKMRRRVISSPAWTSSVTKNLNGQAVLTHKTFQMAAFPRSGANGQPEGVFVNMGVDILSFLLLQAMYCQNYKKNGAKPGHNTVVHLRNNCTAAQTILELMLHTRIPLAEVPLNGSAFKHGKTGSVMLYAPSPILGQHKIPFHLKFNELLHSNKVDQNGEYFEANVLSQAIRQSGKWRLLHGLRKCGSSATCSMIYPDTFISGHKDVSAPTHEGQIPPFPVESTAHMQADFKRLMEAFSLVSKLHAENRHEWAQSMAIHAKSLTVAALKYRHLSLTHCAVRGEMPCVAWFLPSNHDEMEDSDRELDSRAFLFTISVDETGFIVLPVQPTHDNTTSVSDAYELAPYEAMPLTHTQHRLKMPHLALQSTLGSGLVYNHETEEVVLRMPGSARVEGVSLPYFLFPIVQYRTFVLLQEDEKIVEAWKGALCEDVRFVELQEVTQMYESWVLSLDETMSFLHQNEDIVLPDNIDCVIFGVDFKWEKKADSENGLRDFKVWGSECRFVLSVSLTAECTVNVWCNNKAELLYRLRHNDYSMITDQGLHLASKNYTEKLLDRHFFHVQQDEKGEFVFYETVYDDVHYRQCRALHKSNTLSLEMIMRSIQNGQNEHRMEELKKIKTVRETMVQNSAKSLGEAQVLQISAECYSLQVKAITDLPVRFTYKKWDSSGPDHDAERLRIGVVDRWRDGRFLHNGQYRVRIPERHDAPERTYQNIEMDFISMSRCMLTEGQAVYLLVDHSSYQLIRFIHPGFSISDEKTHEALLDGSGDCVVQLECYYILNDSKHADPMMMGMRLLLPVSRKMDGIVLHYSDSQENQLVVYANVYHEGTLRIRPTPLPSTLYAVHRTFIVAEEHDNENMDEGIQLTEGVTAVWE
jgi:hypothetical protein